MDWCGCKNCDRKRPWYEKQLFIRWLPAVVGGILFIAQKRLGFYPNLYLSIVGVACQLLGFSFDVGSTHAMHLLKPQFDKWGVDFPFQEENKLLGKDVPSLTKSLFSWPVLLEIVALGIAWWMPGAGVVLGLAHSVAAYNNWQKREAAIAMLRAT
jgi:hypothetical protein